VKKYNQFQFKSLANWCFDLSKAWFITGVIGSVGIPQASHANRTLLFLAGIIGTWLFLQVGLYLSRDIQE